MKSLYEIKRNKRLTPSNKSILENFPKARDSDQWLTIKLWAVYFPSRIHEEKLNEGTEFETIRKFVYLEDIMALPREDNIKRLRAKIQNEEHKWLPTTIEIAKKRHIEESVWINYVNYN